MSDIIEDSFEDRFKAMFVRGSYSDITLQVKYKSADGKDKCWRLPCHKTLLMLSSTFFREQLNANDGSTLVIKENDIKFFKIIMEYIYTNKLELSSFQTDDVMSLIVLSQKYKVLDLIEHCVSSLFGSDGEDKICCKACLIRYFNLGVEKQIKCLIASCLKIICLSADSLFQHAAFLLLTPNSLRMIVEQDNLNISEMGLYTAILYWAQNICIKDNAAQLIHTTNTTNLDFDVRWIENKAVNIIHIERLNEETLSKSDLNELYRTHSHIRKSFNNIENKIDDFWIKIRKFLDESDITKYIRFLALDPAEFSLKFSNKNILTDKELSDILIIQNSSKMLLEPPPGISNIRKPRKVYNNFFSKTKVRRRIHLSILFDFISTHIFNTENENPANLFNESFIIASEHPLMIMAIILPPKLKKQASGSRYDEDVSVSLYKMSENGESRLFLASGSFQGRRNYQENLTLMLKYYVKIENDAFLLRNCEILVEISRLSKGTYMGGLTRTPLNQEHQFIVTKNNIQKGIIGGFGYCIVDPK